MQIEPILSLVTTVAVVLSVVMFGAGFLGLCLLAVQASAQSPAAVPVPGASKTVNATNQSPLQKSVEAYLRHVYAFGPEVQLTISEPKPSMVAGLLETTVELKIRRKREGKALRITPRSGL